MIPVSFNIGSVGGAGGGGVTVPADAPLLPAQVFVDQIEQWTRANGIAMADTGATYVDPALVATNVPLQVTAIGAPTFDFTNCALTTANIDAILAATYDAAFASGASGNMYLAGAYMGSPTPAGPAAAQVPGIVELDFANLNIALMLADGSTQQAGSWQFPGYGYPTLYFVPGLGIASSTADAYSLAVGIADSPSIADIAIKIVDLWSIGMAGQPFPTNAAALVTGQPTRVRFYDVLDADLPLVDSFSPGGGTGASVTVSSFSAGSPSLMEQINADLTGLMNAFNWNGTYRDSNGNTAYF